MTYDKYAFGINVRRFLADKGMTGQQLEEKAGIGEGTISRYLNGHISPNLVNLCRIAKILDVSLDDLTVGVLTDD